MFRIPAYVALQHVADTQASAEFARVARFFLELKRRTTGRDAQLAIALQCSEQLFGQAVRKELIVGCFTQVNKRQDRDGGRRLGRDLRVL